MSFVKDVQAVLDYLFDWSAWLAVGETIQGAPVITTPVGITSGSPATTNTGTTVTVWLSGGSVGQTYTIGCRITTTAGRVDERSLTVSVTER